MHLLYARSIYMGATEAIDASVDSAISFGCDLVLGFIQLATISATKTEWSLANWSVRYTDLVLVRVEPTETESMRNLLQGPHSTSLDSS